MSLEYSPALHRKGTIKVQLNASDVIPQHYSIYQKVSLMTNKMWDCELTGNHLKAEYWRRRLVRFEGNSLAEKRKKLQKIHRREAAQLERKFDGKCQVIVDAYSAEIEALNDDSVSFVQRLKQNHCEDRKILTFALKESYGTARINKRILDLRKMEFALGRSKQFVEAQQVKELIERLQKGKAEQHFAAQLEKDSSAKQQLDKEHKQELRGLLNKLALRKTKLYKNFQAELLKLETWKAVHDSRLRNDELKLEKKLHALAPPRRARKISHLLDDRNDDDPAATRILKRCTSINAALRSYRRTRSLFDASANLQFLGQSQQALERENERLATVHSQRLDGWDRRTRHVVFSADFVQFVDGMQRGRRVFVQGDDV